MFQRISETRARWGTILALFTLTSAMTSIPRLAVAEELPAVVANRVCPNGLIRHDQQPDAIPVLPRLGGGRDGGGHGVEPFGPGVRPLRFGPTRGRFRLQVQRPAVPPKPVRR